MAPPHPNYELMAPPLPNFELMAPPLPNYKLMAPPHPNYELMAPPHPNYELIAPPPRQDVTSERDQARKELDTARAAAHARAVVLSALAADGAPKTALDPLGAAEELAALRKENAVSF